MIEPAIQVVPHKLQGVVTRELEPGERVVWSGVPKPRFFTGGTLATFLFAIPWTAFSIFWVVAATGFKIPRSLSFELLFPLFGVPFILVGIGMFLSPLFAYRNALRTAYIITDRRAITIDGGRSRTIRSFTPEKLSNIFRREHRDGTSDIIISRDGWKDSEGDKRTQELGFFRIHNAKTAESMLKQLAARAVRSERRDI